jgi:hypothetical protein
METGCFDAAACRAVRRMLAALLLAAVAGGCSQKSNPVAPGPPTAGAGDVTGRAVDGLSDQGVSGLSVHVDGVGDGTTAGDGSFALSSSDAPQNRGVTLTGGGVVAKRGWLIAPGPSVTFALIPAAFNVNAFNTMFRGNGGVLHRYTAAPSIVVIRRTLRFSTLNDLVYTATGDEMSDGEIDGLVTDLTWALDQLSAHAFNAFASVQIESPGDGQAVTVSRSGLITVARYEGLTAGSAYWGYTRWSWNGAGQVVSGIMMLDRDFERSASPYHRSLRSHELGHALGYNHLASPASVMNSDARTEPTAFDRDGARLAFERPPLNANPDVDPDPAVVGTLDARRETWVGAP